MYVLNEDRRAKRWRDSLICFCRPLSPIGKTENWGIEDGDEDGLGTGGGLRTGCHFGTGRELLAAHAVPAIPGPWIPIPPHGDMDHGPCPMEVP